MTIENESKRPLDGSLKWGGNTYKSGHNSGYKRGLPVRIARREDPLHGVLTSVLRHRAALRDRISGLFVCNGFGALNR